MEHSKSLRPSFLLQAYLLLTIILDAALLRTLWLSSLLDAGIRNIYTATIAIKFIILVLEAKEKRSYSSPEYSNNSPEEYSGLYSQGVFWWLNRLIWQGTRNVLQPRDLYSLPDDMTAESLGPRFWSQWTKREKAIP